MNQVVFEHTPIAEFEFQIVHGDLTKESVDAIVNAANRQLRHGGGVAAAIADAGGREIQEQSTAWVRQHGPIDHAHPAITDAGDLAAKFIIHAAGPRWGEGDEHAKLQLTIATALALANTKGCRSLALPAISTGIFAFPLVPAAQAIMAGINDFVDGNPQPTLARIRLVLWDADSVPVFVQAAEAQWPAT